MSDCINRIFTFFDRFLRIYEIISYAQIFGLQLNLTGIYSVIDAPDQPPQFYIGNTILSVSEGIEKNGIEELLQIYQCTSGECDFAIVANDPDIDLSWNMKFDILDATDNLSNDRMSNLEIAEWADPCNPITGRCSANIK